MPNAAKLEIVLITSTIAPNVSALAPSTTVRCGTAANVLRIMPVPPSARARSARGSWSGRGDHRFGYESGRGRLGRPLVSLHRDRRSAPLWLETAVILVRRP